MKTKTRVDTNWRQIYTPIPWKPKVNDELEGYYGGSFVRNGKDGEYIVYIVNTEINSFALAGKKLNDLFSIAQPKVDEKIKIVYKGLIRLDENRSMKQYEFFVQKI